jgi:hypothetical protein
VGGKDRGFGRAAVQAELTSVTGRWIRERPPFPEGFDLMVCAITLGLGSHLDP